MTLGIIRVLTTSDRSLLEEHARLLQRDYGVQTLTRCIPDQSTGIFDDASEALAVPKIVQLGQELVDAVNAAGMFAVEMLGAAAQRY